MKISGQQYSMMYGPTVGDKVRLADTDLIIEVEKDYTTYGDEIKFGGGKTIRLNLRKNGKSGAVLEVYNDLDAPPLGDLSCLFDRFYRADDSRERRTGGYGIGLSIAAATAAAHRATLCAEARGCGIVFTLVLK